MPKLQIDVPFYEVEGNPCSIELTNKKAKLKQIDETSGGEDRKNVTCYNTYLHPVMMLSCWSILFDIALIEHTLAEFAICCCSSILDIKLCPHN